MKKGFKIFIFPLLFLLIFIISKLILNYNNLEFMSWVYYFVFLIIMLYTLIATICVLIHKKLDILTNIVTILGELISFIIIAVIINIFIGTTYKLENKNFVQEDHFWYFRPNEYLYEYKNFIIRGTEKLACPENKCY